MEPGVAHWPLHPGVEVNPDVAEDVAPSHWRAYWDSMVADVGCFRALRPNRHWLTPEKRMLRSSQPAPYQIRGLARRGLKTIINLRGPSRSGSYYLEVDACRKLGVELVNFRIKSRDCPDPKTLHGFYELLGSIPYPALMHCKSGADRAGIASVLYLMWIEGVPLAQARSELSLRYGHVRQGRTGILDYFLETFENHHQTHGTDFWDWVDNHYDINATRDGFRTTRIGNLITDKILRRE